MNAPDIYPFTHRRQRLLSKVTNCTSGAGRGSVLCSRTSTLGEEESGSILECCSGLVPRGTTYHNTNTITNNNSKCRGVRCVCVCVCVCVCLCWCVCVCVCV